MIYFSPSSNRTTMAALKIIYEMLNKQNTLKMCFGEQERQKLVCDVNESLSKLNVVDEPKEHPWTKLNHISDGLVALIIKKIKDGSFTPTKIFNMLNNLNFYITVKQLRTIQQGCSELYANYNNWYLFDHALCARVTDRWNLTPKYKAEGYYYCTRDENRIFPPYKWQAMQLDQPFWSGVSFL